MTRFSLLNSPLLLGFDQFERRLESIAKTSAEGYPPYNIEQIGGDQLRISIAVAGFPLEDLEIDLVDSELIIKGHKQEQDKRTFIHRGIANRQFKRTFILAEGIKVVSALLDGGLLHINLRQPKPEKVVKNIKITLANPSIDNETINISPKEE